MKKLFAIAILCLFSATAIAGGNRGWNNGWRGGWNNGHGGGCYNCGWAAIGGIVAGVAIGSAISSPPVWAGPQVVVPQPIVVGPPVIYQSQTIVNIPQPRNELDLRLAQAYQSYANGSLTYQEYMSLRASIIENFSKPR